MSFQVSGKVAVVTGGSSGIGLETVRLLLEQGAYVAWCGRDSGRLQDSWETMAACFESDRLYIQCCDVLNADAIKQFIEQVAQRFGGVDMLINNAGLGSGGRFGVDRLLCLRQPPQRPAIARLLLERLLERPLQPVGVKMPPYHLQGQTPHRIARRPVHSRTVGE